MITIVAPYNMNVYDKNINDFYHSPLSDDLNSRISMAANYFIGAPYLFESLGEGLDGEFSQQPLYRTECFDCVTFVDTVLALAKSENLSEFKENILKIRYLNQTINYTTRTDWFTDLEWIPNLQKLGWLKEYSGQTLLAETIIDKPNWYRQREIKDLHLLEPVTANERLAKLQAKHQEFKPQKSLLNYMPINNDAYPDAAVIAIVRPNWPIRDSYKFTKNGYGTNLNVSHLGLVLREQDNLMFYHASYNQKKVVKQLLNDYLKDYLQHETVKGIHVEKII